MLSAVMEQQAGIICVWELSRLVRDNQDWNQPVRLCRHQVSCSADEYRVYDPADPQDRVVRHSGSVQRIRAGDDLLTHAEEEFKGEWRLIKEGVLYPDIFAVMHSRKRGCAI